MPSPKTPRRIDASDARILLALNKDPRATVVALADASGLSRNTVQARILGLESDGRLRSPEGRIDPAALGYPLTAVILVRVRQRLLDSVADDLARIPEVVEVMGVSGDHDLHVRTVAADADDLYRIAGHVLAIDGVERTETRLVMRRLVPYRLTPLLERAVAGGSAE
jgi:DNA-binding Lrp family transcriptional regulator